MHHKPIHQCFSPLIIRRCLPMTYPVLVLVSKNYPSLRGQVAYVLLTRSPLLQTKQAWSSSVRLACIRHAASVYPEPGSNSPFELAHSLTLTFVSSFHKFLDVSLLNSCSVFKDQSCIHDRGANQYITPFNQRCQQLFSDFFLSCFRDTLIDWR